MNVHEIPYVRSDGRDKRASVIPVEVSLDGLSEEDIQVIGHLSRASDQMMPIGARQHYDSILGAFSALIDLERTLEDPEARDAMRDYNDIFAGRNSPWSSTDSLGSKFPLSRDQIPEGHPILEYLDVLETEKAPDGRSYYPGDVKKEDVENLEDALKSKF